MEWVEVPEDDWREGVQISYRLLMSFNQLMNP